MPAIARLVTVFGAVVVLLSLFALPWVTAPGLSETEGRVDSLLTKVGVQSVLERLPENVLGRRPAGPFGARAIRATLIDPELQRMFAAAEQGEVLTAWRIWRDQFPLKDVLRSGLMASALAAVLGLLAAVLSLLRSGSVLALFLALFSVPPIAILLWFLPSIQTFGQHDDFQLAIACVLLDTRTGPGPYLALLGLVTIVAGAIFTHLAVRGEEFRRTLTPDSWEQAFPG